MAISLDKIDFLILQKLIEDGRSSFSGIARESGLTDVAIKKRIERLKRKGIIQSVTANLNYKVLGYENPIFLQIRTEIGKNRDILKKLNEMDFIVELCQVLGEYNLLAKIIVPSIDGTEQIIQRIGTIDGVVDTKTMVVLQEAKKTSTLPTQSMQKNL